MKKYLFLLFITLLYSISVAQSSVTNEPSDLFVDSTFYKEDLNDLRDEKILLFESNIDVQSNDKIVITEKIKVIANGREIKRGIYRSLPVVRNVNNKKHRVQYSKISIKKNGIKEPFHLRTSDNKMTIYVGDKDIFLKSGVYEYEIKYETSDQIGFFESFDELYWNVNGNDWNFDIDKIVAKVHLPKDANIIQSACYEGAYGDKGQGNCSKKEINNNTIEYRSKGLNRKKGLTIAVGFNKGIVKPTSFKDNIYYKTYGGLYIVLLTVLILIWKKFGKDPPSPIIYPRYDVPDDLSPAEVGYLMNCSVNEIASAAIVNLAIKGYLKITDEQKGKTKYYSVEKLKDPEEELSEEEEIIMDRLFLKDKEKLTFKSKNASILNSMLNKVNQSISSRFKDIKKDSGIPRSIWVRIYLSFLSLFFVPILYMSIKYSTWELLIMVSFVAFWMTVTFVNFTQIENSCFKVGFTSMFALVGIALLSAITYFSGFDLVIAATIFYILGFVTLLIFFDLGKRPSDEMVKYQADIEGLKMYLGTAEKERMRILNPPEMTPEVFEKFLPYAMVLGVSKIWGDKFENKLRKSSQVYDHEWYQGNDFRSFTSNSIYSSDSLSNSISNYSKSYSSSSYSGGSSSSGSSGGGSSGGGGGGGGGGGW